KVKVFITVLIGFVEQMLVVECPSIGVDPAMVGTCDLAFLMGGRILDPDIGYITFGGCDVSQPLCIGRDGDEVVSGGSVENCAGNKRWLRVRGFTLPLCLACAGRGHRH